MAIKWCVELYNTVGMSYMFIIHITYYLLFGQVKKNEEEKNVFCL